MPPPALAWPLPPLPVSPLPPVDRRAFQFESASTGRLLSSGVHETLEARYTGRQSRWLIDGSSDGTIRIVHEQTGRLLTGGVSTSVHTSALKHSSKAQSWNLSATSAKLPGLRWVQVINHETGRALAAVAEEQSAGATTADLDARYYQRTHSVGGVQQLLPNSSHLNQLWHIAPIRDAPSAGWALPSLGWTEAQPKLAVLVSRASIPLQYTLSRDNVPVRSGPLSSAAEWGLQLHSVDLTAAAEAPGLYELRSSSGETATFVVRRSTFAQSSGGEGEEKSTFDHHGGLLASPLAMLRGFWSYQRFYTLPQRLVQATMGPHDKDPVPMGKAGDDATGRSTAPTSHMSHPRHGWFDANSRDSKTARTATAAQWLAYASLAWMESGERGAAGELADELAYVLEFFSETIDASGGWPLGKVRQGCAPCPAPCGPRLKYYWVTSIDTGAKSKIIVAETTVSIVPAETGIRGTSKDTTAETVTRVILIGAGTRCMRRICNRYIEGTADSVVLVPSRVLSGTGRAVYMGTPRGASEQALVVPIGRPVLHLWHAQS